MDSTKNPASLCHPAGFADLTISGAPGRLKFGAPSLTLRFFFLVRGFSVVVFAVVRLCASLYGGCVCVCVGCLCCCYVFFLLCVCMFVLCCAFCCGIVCWFRGFVVGFLFFLNRTNFCTNLNLTIPPRGWNCWFYPPKSCRLMSKDEGINYAQKPAFVPVALLEIDSPRLLAGLYHASDSLATRQATSACRIR